VWVWGVRTMPSPSSTRTCSSSTRTWQAHRRIGYYSTELSTTARMSVLYLADLGHARLQLRADCARQLGLRDSERESERASEAHEQMEAE
jgi:hypothetical protein